MFDFEGAVDNLKEGLWSDASDLLQHILCLMVVLVLNQLVIGPLEELDDLGLGLVQLMLNRGVIK